MPDHAFGVSEGNGQCKLRRRIERSSRLRQTAERTGSGMRGRCAGLIVQTTPLTRAVADDGSGQRIGHRLAGRQTGGDRRQHLHRQSEQDQG